MKEKDLENKIEESLSKIDSGSVTTPDIMHFNNLVKSKKALQSKRQNIQFIAFIIFAMIFVPFIISSFLKNFTVFIVLQSLALICPVIWYLVEKLLALRRRKLKYE